MGICIHISISKSVTKKEWKAVYEETLKLVEVFPLAEKRKVECRGIDTICLVPTVEREETYGWYDEKTRRGWTATSDYETLAWAEEYYLTRDLIEDSQIEQEQVDAMFCVLPAYMSYSWNDSRFAHNYDLWGNKTQGESHHIYLLAIACLIESRLKEKAFVYGDITRGQCKEAVRMANEHLDIPIDIPDRCDAKRLLKRVSKFSVSESEQLDIFETFYLGNQDKEFGKYLREVYSKEVCREYWKHRFDGVKIETIGFGRAINDYLNWGFELDELCGVVNFLDEEGNAKYDKFIQCLLDRKLHIKEKECTDNIAIDQERTQPYGVERQFAQIFFEIGGLTNKKIDRYIPMEEIRSVLNKEIGDKCDVDQLIDDYIENENMQMKKALEENGSADNKANEQDNAELFNKAMDAFDKEYQSEKEKYTIIEYEDLPYYEKGDTLHPVIAESLGKSYLFYQDILLEEKYKKLLKKSAKKRCEWLIENNKYILIRDKDWEHIFIDIEENEDAFSRYYPMMRVKVTRDAQLPMILAMALNDDLYNYCKELARMYEEKEK